VRDPARIDRMIEKLRQHWHRNPDIRLGQLVVNLGRDQPMVSTFHIDDDVIERAMDAARSMRPIADAAK
jgi:uncharacterized protein YihD (DUF1040 family)